MKPFGPLGPGFIRVVAELFQLTEPLAPAELLERYELFEQGVI